MEPVDDPQISEHVYQAPAERPPAGDELSRLRTENAQLRAQVEQLGGEPAGIVLPTNDIHFQLARGCLWLIAIGSVAFLFVSVPGYIAIAHDDPPFGDDLDYTVQGLIMAGIVNAFFSPSGIGAAISLWGIHKRKKYGWVAGIIAFGINLLFCMPIGVYGLIAFLRSNVREAFFGRPAAAQPPYPPPGGMPPPPQRPPHLAGPPPGYPPG